MTIFIHLIYKYIKIMTHRAFQILVIILHENISTLFLFNCVINVRLFIFILYNIFLILAHYI